MPEPPMVGVQGVPDSGWHVPFLQCFLPFFVRHLPFVQPWHVPQAGLHLPDMASTPTPWPPPSWPPWPPPSLLFFASASLRPRRPSAPPRSAPRVTRRLVNELNDLVASSNRVSAMRTSRDPEARSIVPAAVVS